MSRTTTQEGALPGPRGWQTEGARGFSGSAWASASLSVEPALDPDTAGPRAVSGR